MTPIYDDLPDGAPVMSYDSIEGKLRIRTKLTITHKDGTVETKNVNVAVPFKWQGDTWGSPFENAVKKAARAAIEGIMRKMCEDHDCNN